MLTGTTTPGQSGPGSNNNEGELYIPQCPSTEAPLSDNFVSYPELKGSDITICRDAEMQSAYSTAPPIYIYIYMKVAEKHNPNR